MFTMFTDAMNSNPIILKHVIIILSGTIYIPFHYLKIFVIYVRYFSNIPFSKSNTIGRQSSQRKSIKKHHTISKLLDTLLIA